MAAGDLPPHVVSGQPIASVWGNNVVDELLRQRNEVEVFFSHPGGSSAFLGPSLIGKVTLGALAYPIQIRTITQFTMGYAGCGIACSARLHTMNAGDINGGDQYIHAARYITQSLVAVWSVPAGSDPSFETHCVWNATETSGVSVYFNAAGVYRLQRVGTP